MKRVQVWVNVDGQQVLAGERKTERTYGWAVVMRDGEGAPLALSYHRSMVLAQRQVAQCRVVPGRTYEVASTLEVEMQRRTAPMCTGLVRKTQKDPNGWPTGWRRCTRKPGEGGITRCAEHAAQDLDAFKWGVQREQEQYSAAQQAKWDAEHAARYTVDTCPVRGTYRHGCRVHGK